MATPDEAARCSHALLGELGLGGSDVARLQAMPMDVLPQNQDGEVSEFLCMSPHEVMAALRQQAFSVDAGCVIAQGVLGSDIALQSP
jgi:hypothetical protein